MSSSKKFKSVSLIKTAVLSSLATAFTVVISIFTKIVVDRITRESYEDDEKYKKYLPPIHFSKIIITLFVTYSFSMIIFIFLYYAFGWNANL